MLMESEHRGGAEGGQRGSCAKKIDMPPFTSVRGGLETTDGATEGAGPVTPKDRAKPSRNAPMTLQTFVTPTLTIVALSSLGALACDSTTEPEAGQDFHGGLLFDLTEEELVEIHATYLADEDIELTRSRLT